MSEFQGLSGEYGAVVIRYLGVAYNLCPARWEDLTQVKLVENPVMGCATNSGMNYVRGKSRNRKRVVGVFDSSWTAGVNLNTIGVRAGISVELYLYARYTDLVFTSLDAIVEQLTFVVEADGMATYDITFTTNGGYKDMSGQLNLI